MQRFPDRFTSFAYIVAREVSFGECVKAKSANLYNDESFALIRLLLYGIIFWQKLKETTLITKTKHMLKYDNLCRIGGRNYVSFFSGYVCCNQFVDSSAN